MEILNRRRLSTWPPKALYVGRGHPLGNPYHIGKDGTREEVIAQYRDWIESRLEAGDEEIIEAFRYLREDYSLVCSCAPLPCHAEVIREIWERDFKDKPLVFVFGSNLAGRHGKGAAEFARRMCCAIPGQAEGLQGSAYGIPTKDRYFNPLPVPEIAVAVRRFLDFARAHPKLELKVSAIGCGLAGYTSEQIAPMFATAPENCRLPEEFAEVLKPWRNLGRFSTRLMVSCGCADTDPVYRKLDQLTRNFDPADTALLSGGGPAEDWARKRGIKVFRFEPYSAGEPCPAGEPYSAKASINRNAWMLTSATHAVFFWDGKDYDTQDSIRLARRMGMPMREIFV